MTKGKEKQFFYHRMHMHSVDYDVWCLSVCLCLSCANIL